MLSICKISQHINTDTCKWIPSVPFDRIWMDELVYDYFGITEREISDKDDDILEIFLLV